MDKPWTDDFAALADRSRHQLRSLAATRAHVLSTQETPKMRLFTRRPVLAVLFLLALAGVASGAVYAVDRVFLQVDPDKSPEELERDVKAQLESAGVQADVTAHKRSDDKVEIRVMSNDQTLPAKLEVTTPSGDAIVAEPLQLEVEVTCLLTEAQTAQLTAAASGSGLVSALVGDHDDAETAAIIKRELAKSGFKDVDVEITDDQITVTVKSPPTP